MEKSKGEDRYILVIKDDATKMVLLRNEVSAGGQEAAEALLECSLSLGWLLFGSPIRAVTLKTSW
jgi:hypothetical protein